MNKAIEIYNGYHICHSDRKCFYFVREYSASGFSTVEVARKCIDVMITAEEKRDGKKREYNSLIKMP